MPPLRTPVGAIVCIPRAYVFRMEIEHTALFSLAPWDVLEDLCFRSLLRGLWLYWTYSTGIYVVDISYVGTIDIVHVRSSAMVKA